MFVVQWIRLNQELRVVETRPQSTIVITDCELAIDIIPPEGYESPTVVKVSLILDVLLSVNTVKINN